MGKTVRNFGEGKGKGKNKKQIFAQNQKRERKHRNSINEQLGDATEENSILMDEYAAYEADFHENW